MDQTAACLPPVLTLTMEIITLIQLDPAWSRSPRCSPVVRPVYHNRLNLSTICSINEPLGVANVRRDPRIQVMEVLLEIGLFSRFIRRDRD